MRNMAMWMTCLTWIPNTVCVVDLNGYVDKQHPSTPSNPSTAISLRHNIEPTHHILTFQATLNLCS